MSQSQTQNVQLGRPFKIRLPANPSTGYSWQVKVTPGLQILNSYYRRSRRNAIGGAGQQVWIVRPVELGEQGFVGWYYRPWEASTDTKPIFRLFNVL